MPNKKSTSFVKKIIEDISCKTVPELRMYAEANKISIKGLRRKDDIMKNIIMAHTSLLKKGKRNIKGGAETKKLIITSGDCSDFDGFLALPFYYKAAIKKNCDILFMMTYPQYLADSAGDGDALADGEDPYKQEAGLGYNYSFDKWKAFNKTELDNKLDKLGKLEQNDSYTEDDLNILLRNPKQDEIDAINNEIETKQDELKKKQDELKNIENLIGKRIEWELVAKYLDDVTVSDITKVNYTDGLKRLAKEILKVVWDYCSTTNITNTYKPTLYFCDSIDGERFINTMNPFSPSAIKNEIAVYGETLTSPHTRPLKMKKTGGG